jgi:hypothetical protein
METGFDQYTNLFVVSMGGSSSKSEIPTDPVGVSPTFVRDEIEMRRAQENEMKEEQAANLASEEEAKAKTKERSEELAKKVGLLKKADRCVDEEQQVLQCMKQHRGEPLACFSAVERFEKCSKS